MLNFTNAVLKKTIVHYVGNKIAGSDLVVSKNYIDIVAKDEPDVLNFMVSPFAKAASNQFTHISDIALNPVYNYALEIFDKESNLASQSKNIAKHLYNTSNHSGIKEGELVVSFIKNLYFDDEVVEGIAIVKSESKDKFFKTEVSSDGVSVVIEPGISLNKIDKGCLILNTFRETGFIVLVIDKTNAGEDAQYWKSSFLDIVERDDNFHSTKAFLQVCKSFIKDQMPQESEVSKTEQIELLNKSISYFQENESLDLKAFNQTVLKDASLIKSFNSFKKDMLGKETQQSFPISALAVKQQSKVFKSTLKLDRNFHVYIHGDAALIENGFDDEKGMKYYKLFYTEES